MASVPSNVRARLPRAAAAGTAAVALWSSLLTGCGGSSKAGGQGGGESDGPAVTSATIALPADQPQRPACGLVTQAEVEAAIGAKVSPGKENAQEGRSVCVFTLASGTDQSVVLVSTASSNVPAAFRAAREKAESPQTVSSGDEAFVAGPQALVRKGTTMVAILMALRQQAAQLSSAATRLVQAVSSHL